VGAAPEAGGGTGHGRIVSGADGAGCLDATQLAALEQAYRQWVDQAARPAMRLSRQRILLVFLLIRYTGAKLSEALALDTGADVDFERGVLHLGGAAGEPGAREVQGAGLLARELRARLLGPAFGGAQGPGLGLDPGFVRRKFYELAQAAGFAKRQGGPEMLRKARAVELLQGNVPLPVVQAMLGHVTPAPTSAYVSFSPDDIRQVARVFLEREAGRGSSARNAFYGKVQALEPGDIQARVELATLDGLRVEAVVTSGSVQRLGLRPGRLVAAEVKAPLVSIQLRTPGPDGAQAPPASSQENVYPGVVEEIRVGGLMAECVVRVSEATQLCALVPAAWARARGLAPGDAVWVLCGACAVVLHVD
jgi:molybdate transport system regulatory protein